MAGSEMPKAAEKPKSAAAPTSTGEEELTSVEYKQMRKIVSNVFEIIRNHRSLFSTENCIWLLWKRNLSPFFLELQWNGCVKTIFGPRFPRQYLNLKPTAISSNQSQKYLRLVYLKPRPQILMPISATGLSLLIHTNSYGTVKLMPTSGVRVLKIPVIFEQRGYLYPGRKIKDILLSPDMNKKTRYHV
jgi:hypothetical protein